MTFQDQFFIRFADGEQEAFKEYSAVRIGEKSNSLPTHDKKSPLLSLYRRRLLEAGFVHVLQFEDLSMENKHSLHQFFGTTSEVAVRKFKDGLWEVDGLAGQRFRDPRDPDQLSFDISEPDFVPRQEGHPCPARSWREDDGGLVSVCPSRDHLSRSARQTNRRCPH